MAIDPNSTVAQIALENPKSAAIFEKLGIDYCCGGRKPLQEACQAAGLDPAEVLASLQQSQPAGQQQESANVNKESLAGLVYHIVRKHHAYCREEGERLEALAGKVAAKHGENHPELQTVRSLFLELRQELTLHMMKEERMLFPHIIRLEEAATLGTAPPAAPFGSVQNPVRMMVQEHDGAGALLKQISAATEGYQVPEGACNSYRAFYVGLDAFEKDLHQHIHLENNLLFPKAIALEDAGNGHKEV